MRFKTGLIALSLTALAGCATFDTDTRYSTKSAPAADATMRWDALPGSETWTETTLAALDSHGSALTSVMPADIDAWCPAYRTADMEGRKAFWTGLISTLAKHESTWNPRAVGGGGRWFGLVQISPATARHYGCAAGSGSALQDGDANLSCAVRIMNVTVPRDGVVSQGMRGVAADWGPFHSSTKREDMRSWMQAQTYCAAG